MKPFIYQCAVIAYRQDEEMHVMTIEIYQFKTDFFIIIIFCFISLLEPGIVFLKACAF